MHATLRALREHIRPEWAQWTEPRGGYLIWLQLKRLPAPAADVDALLASHGVRAALGRFFFSSEKPDRYLRLSISNLSEEEIAEGVNRLARALREAYAREPSRNARRGGHR